MIKKISIISPCLNEERNITRFLDSIDEQDYPHDAIEVLIADGMSGDKTRELIAEWKKTHDIDVRIVDNPRVVAEFGNAEALKIAKGEYMYLLGADERLAQKDLLTAFVRAFEIFPDIAGVEQEFLPIPGGSVFNNFLAAIHIGDPLAMDIAIKPRLIEKKKVDHLTYRKYEFRPGYPATPFLKMSYLKEFIGEDTFEEGQVMLRLELSGNNRFIIIDGYGLYHYNVRSLRHFLRKRAKTALKHTTRIQERKTWVSYTGKRLYIYAFLHLTLIYPLIYSIIMAIRKRSIYWLLFMPSAFITTFVYLINWVRLKITKKKAW